MKRVTQIALFAVFFAVSGAVHAQVDVEPEVVTDSLSFTDTEEGSRKSRTVATLTTLLLPGLGHQYLGNERRAMLYFTTELVSWLGLAFNEGYSRKLLSDSRALAFSHAGVTKGLPADSSYYWQLLRHYDDWESYNRDMKLNRTPELKYVDEDLDWQWEDEFYKEQYGQLREKATNFHVVGSFFIAGAVLNRVIAFIDIRIATRHKASSVAGLHFQPTFDPLSERTALRYRAHSRPTFRSLDSRYQSKRLLCGDSSIRRTGGIVAHACSLGIVLLYYSSYNILYDTTGSDSTPPLERHLPPPEITTNGETSRLTIKPKAVVHGCE